MKRKILILYIFISVLSAPAILAMAALLEEGTLDSGKVFNKAGVYYEKKDWGKAIQEYESILGQGIKSGNLFYNLGNCYLKKGDLGMAILNYERARRLIPRDSDLLFNYRYARSLMKQQDPPYPRNLLENFVIDLFEYINLNENIIIACALYYAIVVFIILSLFIRKARVFFIFLVFIIVSVFIIQFIPVAYKITGQDQGAIVVADITDARFEPLGDSDVHFPLYGGMRVDILRTQGNWRKVQRSDGKIGWVRNETVELIKNDQKWGRFPLMQVISSK